VQQHHRIRAERRDDGEVVGSSSVTAWRSTPTPSISSNMPLSDMMPSWRSLSGLCWRKGVAARLVALSLLPLREKVARSAG
jgi:hypothetical protein